MKGTIAHFRQGRHHQYTNQMIIHVEGIDSAEKAEGLKGKTVTFVTETGKKLRGRISNIHGNSGAVRAIFQTGMPGQSLGKQVEIN